jgi:hypothetical protein
MIQVVVVQKDWIETSTKIQPTRFNQPEDGNEGCCYCWELVANFISSHLQNDDYDVLWVIKWFMPCPFWAILFCLNGWLALIVRLHSQVILTINEILCFTLYICKPKTSQEKHAGLMLHTNANSTSIHNFHHTTSLPDLNLFSYVTALLYSFSVITVPTNVYFNVYL